MRLTAEQRSLLQRLVEVTNSLPSGTDRTFATRTTQQGVSIAFRNGTILKEVVLPDLLELESLGMIRVIGRVGQFYREYHAYVTNRGMDYQFGWLQEGTPQTQSKEPAWDFFISHASEDKLSVAQPLAQLLENHGYKVWLDSLELKVGDSLRGKIDDGLAKSRYGIIILSPRFLSKDWPQKELGALLAKETKGVKVLLPVWHDLSSDDLVRLSPMMADRFATNTSKGLQAVAQDIIDAARI